MQDSVYTRVSEAVLSKTSIIRDLSDVVLMYLDIRCHDEHVAQFRPDDSETIFVSKLNADDDERRYKLAVFEIVSLEDSKETAFTIMAHLLITPLESLHIDVGTITYIKMRLPFNEVFVSTCIQTSCMISSDHKQLSTRIPISHIQSVEWEVKVDGNWTLVDDRCEYPCPAMLLTMQYRGFSEHRFFSSKVLNQLTGMRKYNPVYQFSRGVDNVYELWIYVPDIFDTPFPHRRLPLRIKQVD